MARIGSSPFTGASNSHSPTAISDDLWQPVLSGMQEYARNYSAAMTAFNSEWHAFVNRRLQEDFALPQRLAACKAPDEAMQIYSSFVQKAVSDYQSEFAELSKIGSVVASSAAGTDMPDENSHEQKSRQAS